MQTRTFTRVHARAPAHEHEHTRLNKNPGVCVGCQGWGQAYREQAIGDLPQRKVHRHRHFLPWSGRMACIIHHHMHIMHVPPWRGRMPCIMPHHMHIIHNMHIMRPFSTEQDPKHKPKISKHHVNRTQPPLQSQQPIELVGTSGGRMHSRTFDDRLFLFIGPFELRNFQFSLRFEEIGAF